MTCFHPLVGFRITFSDGSVKVVVDKPAKFYSDSQLKKMQLDSVDGYCQFLLLPCGHCIGCRLEHSRQWAVRCVHEAQLHDQNCFLTLTYDDDHLPPDGSLVKKDLTDFWKRLRKAVGYEKIRYFACGEYGERFARPHYHACVFGWFPDDAVLYRASFGTKLYISPLLQRVWPFGYSTVGNVTFESAAYVARYVMKKISGDAAEEHYRGRLPEYTVMSRRPGIAHDWIEKYQGDVYPHDFVVIRDNIKCRPPRYYDKIYDEICPDQFSDVLSKRKENLSDKFYSGDDLNRVESVKKITLKKCLKRHYEEGF